MEVWDEPIFPVSITTISLLRENKHGPTAEDPTYRNENTFMPPSRQHFTLLFLSFDCIYNCNTAITKQRHDKQVKYKFIYMRKPDLGNQQDQRVLAHLNQALLCLSRNDQKEPVYNIRLRSWIADDANACLVEVVPNTGSFPKNYLFILELPGLLFFVGSYTRRAYITPSNLNQLLQWLRRPRLHCQLQV